MTFIKHQNSQNQILEGGAPEFQGDPELQLQSCRVQIPLRLTVSALPRQ